MDDLRVNLNKLQIGCLYADTLINYMVNADDLCILSPSVASLRNLTDCCAKYGELFNIVTTGPTVLLLTANPRA